MMKFDGKKLVFVIAVCAAALLIQPLQPVARTVKSEYFEAEACHSELLKNPAKQKYRKNWLRCIDKFQSVYKNRPLGSWAAAGMYMSGVLYGQLYSHSGHPSDRKEALDVFERVQKRFPKSGYSQKAASALLAIQEAERAAAVPKAAGSKPKSAAPKPKASSAPDAISKLIHDSNRPQSGLQPDGKKSATPTNAVTGVRFWSNPTYTRVVVDAENEAEYMHRLLRKDPSINVAHQRLYVDLKKTRLSKGIPKFIPIHDNLLLDVRAGQYRHDLVRVVVDLKSFRDYKIFSLRNPFRIVIDVWGEEKKKLAQAKPKPKPAKPKPKAAKPKTVPKPKPAKIKPKVAPKPVPKAKKKKPEIKKKIAKVPKGALARQLALGVRKIVIDAGHGGRDYGAPGYLKGVHEKKIVLAIAKRLARKIKRELNCQVVMTRSKDRYLTLEERTAIANTKNADLFISIHTNSHRDRRAYGIETYFLNLATDEESIRVAARENATSTKNISDLQTILNDLMQNAKVNESSRLATLIQDAIHRKLKKKYSRIKNKGVKQAPFYVLLGAQMPAVLIETSFISNARECKRLVNTHYQELLCSGIIQGIRKYIQMIHPAALRRTGSQRTRKG